MSRGKNTTNKPSPAAIRAATEVFRAFETKNVCQLAAIIDREFGPALEACEAHAAWFWAEHESPKSTTFEERVELANYSEWLTAKALNRSAPEKYQGIPKMLIWPECRIHRGSAEEVRAIVDAVLDKYRAAIAQLEVR